MALGKSACVLFGFEGLPTPPEGTAATEAWVDGFPQPVEVMTAHGRRRFMEYSLEVGGFEPHWLSNDGRTLWGLNGDAITGLSCATGKVESYPLGINGSLLEFRPR